MNTPVWQLQAFDRAGNIIGTITKHPNLPVVRTGAPGAFALFATRDIELEATETPGEIGLKAFLEIERNHAEKLQFALNSSDSMVRLLAKRAKARRGPEAKETPGDHDFTIGGEIRVQEVEQRLDLQGALPVDFQHDIFALIEPLLNGIARGAVKVVVHLGPFEELAAGHHGPELALVDEPVLTPMLLLAARRACGVRHRQSQMGVEFEQRVDQT